MAFAKPNLTLPLAVSYNERGVDGYAATVTNSLDQRKINCIYEPVNNAMTGQTTLYLAKRPGVTNTGFDFGSTTDGRLTYLVGVVPDPSDLVSPDNSQAVLFSKNNSNEIKSNAKSGGVTIETIASYTPAYWDMTAISNTPTLVLQLNDVNASTGLSQQRVWYSSDIYASTGGTWARITDADFPGSTATGKMEFMDGYAFVASQTTAFIHNSDINSLANWTANSKIRKQIVEDVNIGLGRLGKQIICWGYETMEVFYNAGHSTGSPLSTIPGLFSRTGCVKDASASATHYYTTIGNTIYWVGRQWGRGISYSMFAFNGSGAPTVVSSPSINKILDGATVYNVGTIMVKGRPYVAIGLSTVNATPQRWLMFSPEWKEWFEWTSTIFRPVNNGLCFIGKTQDQAYSFMNSGGTALSEKWQDDTTDYTMTVQFQLPKDGNHRKRMPMCGVVADTARSASSLNVEFSDDDYQTWTTARAIDMTSQQKLLARCGSYRNRAVRLTHTGNLDCRIEKFMARIE